MMGLKNINVSEEVFYQITELYNTENKKKEMKYQWNHYKQVKKGDKFDVGLGTIIFYFKKSVNQEIYKDTLTELYEDKQEIIKPDGNKYSRQYLSDLFETKDKEYKNKIVDYMNEYFGYVYEPQAYLFKQYKNKQYIKHIRKVPEWLVIRQ